jgi:hypothetical protein
MLVQKSLVQNFCTKKAVRKKLVKLTPDLRVENGCLWIRGIILVPHFEEKHFG